MLSPEALLERRKGIGGSDAIRIMSGDWYALWCEKTGRKEAEDLSGVWAVQLGIVTETLNLDWYERTRGVKLVNRGKVCVSDDYPFLRCTLDGFDPTIPAVIQCKHVNAFSKKEDVLEKYTPQVTHEMICTNTADGFLSVIIGAAEPVLLEVEYDDFYASEYIDRCREFWSYVQADKEPPGAPPTVPPPIPRERMRKVDMTGRNEWSSLAADFLENRLAAKRFDAAKDGLKKLVEPDVCEATGHGVIITRSKAGALTVKEI